MKQYVLSEEQLQKLLKLVKKIEWKKANPILLLLSELKTEEKE